MSDTICPTTGRKKWKCPHCKELRQQAELAIPHDLDQFPPGVINAMQTIFERELTDLEMEWWLLQYAQKWDKSIRRILYTEYQSRGDRVHIYYDEGMSCGLCIAFNELYHFTHGKKLPESIIPIEMVPPEFYDKPLVKVSTGNTRICQEYYMGAGVVTGYSWAKEVVTRYSMMLYGKPGIGKTATKPPEDWTDEVPLWADDPSVPLKDIQRFKEAPLENIDVAEEDLKPGDPVYLDTVTGRITRTPKSKLYPTLSLEINADTDSIVHIEKPCKIDLAGRLITVRFEGRRPYLLDENMKELK